MDWRGSTGGRQSLQDPGEKSRGRHDVANTVRGGAAMFIAVWEIRMIPLPGADAN